jgi:hypothetical protein
VSEALAAFALQRPFRSVIRLYLYSQTAELGERSHFWDNRGGQIMEYKEEKDKIYTWKIRRQKTISSYAK